LRNYVNRSGSNWVKFITTVEFGITNNAPFEVVYGYLPCILPPAIYDDSTPATIYFVEVRMLHHLKTQDAIIAAKTDQSEYSNRSRTDPASTSSVINVGDYALRLLEYGRKDNKPARKLHNAAVGWSLQGSLA